MTTWRMAFRVGPRGHEMWPQCLRLGVAAITYDPLAYTDLSVHPKYEPKDLWMRLAPTQKASLGRLAYEMKKGDVIFVKHADRIICQGIVKGKYRYDSEHRIIDPNGVPWSHQVPVAWDTSFPEVKILLGGEQVTVKILSQENVNNLETKGKEAKQSYEKAEAIEGEAYKREVLFRARNRALIQAKKQDSDYRCEKCGLSFYEIYGDIGKNFIIAHHLEPISFRREPSKTTLDDIVLLCANCHAMVHRKQPPLSVNDLELKKRPSGL